MDSYTNSQVDYKPLPNPLFSVRIPFIYTQSKAEADLFGLPVDRDITNNKNIPSHNRLVTVMLRLNRIIDLYIEGCRPITLPNVSDVNKVHSIISEYLINMETLKMHSPNYQVVQDKRLPEIIKFAEEILSLNYGIILKEVTERAKYNPFNVGLDLMDTAPRSSQVKDITPAMLPTNTSGIMQGYSVGYKNENVPQTFDNTNNINYNSVQPVYPVQQPTNDYNSIYNYYPSSAPIQDNFNNIYNNVPEFSIPKQPTHNIFNKKFE